MCPGPPSWILCDINFVEHTSRSHWYTSIPTCLDTSASSMASVTAYSLTHQQMSISHFCSVILVCSKKVSSWIPTLFLHVVTGHRQRYPSTTSRRASQFIGWGVAGVLQVGHSFALASSFFPVYMCYYVPLGTNLI